MTRPRYCPWVTRPTHDRNGRLQVDGWRPVVFGYCPQTPDCASCAGTNYKPNILMQVGRETATVTCPYCAPEAYRKDVTKLRAFKVCLMTHLTTRHPSYPFLMTTATIC